MRGCVETPAELLKTRLQVGAGLGSASLLLRGLRSTCLRNAAAIGLFWLAYEARARNPTLALSRALTLSLALSREPSPEA